MIQPLKNKLYLIFIFLLSKFEAFKFTGGQPAPLSGCFSLKQSKINNGKDSHFREECGVSSKREQIFALFLCSNLLESKMVHTQSSRRRISSRIPLDDKFSILSLAIETAVAKISQIEGSESINAKGIRIAFKEFTKHYKSFTEKHGLFPGNEIKLQQAASKCRAPYNHILNGVLESVNIVPGSERLN